MTGPEGKEQIGAVEFDYPDPVIVPELPCWLECSADHPAAVPFWTVKP